MRPKMNQKRRRGAAMVETAIVLLFVFIPILIGIIEIGRAVMVQQILTNAAREGARKAIIPGTSTANVTQIVNDYLDDARILDGGNRVVEIRDQVGNPLVIENAASKQQISVFVSTPYDDVKFGLNFILGGITLSAECPMRKE